MRVSKIFISLTFDLPGVEVQLLIVAAVVAVCWQLLVCVVGYRVVGAAGSGPSP